jgi:hypothetical protein
VSPTLHYHGEFLSIGTFTLNPISDGTYLAAALHRGRALLCDHNLPLQAQGYVHFRADGQAYEFHELPALKTLEFQSLLFLKY